MKAIPLILFALFIDGLQAMLMLTFTVMQFITPVGGGALGGITAAAYCYNATTGFFSALLAGAKCAVGGTVVGAGVSAFAVPLGMGVDVAISITFGGVLVMALAWMGMFYPGTVLGTFLGESIPFLDVLPGWTLMTWRCISKKNAEEKAAAAKKETPAPVVVSQPVRSFDGIRAANDNQSSYAQAA